MDRLSIALVAFVDIVATSVFIFSLVILFGGMGTFPFYEKVTVISSAVFSGGALLFLTNILVRWYYKRMPPETSLRR